MNGDVHASVPHAQAIQAINERFRVGTPSNDLSIAGVLIHQLDGTEAKREPWRPCTTASPFKHATMPPSLMKHRIPLFSQRCAGDRISASIVSAQMPHVYDPSGPGIIISPSHAHILCSYAGDGLSRAKTCSSLETSGRCIPGCYSNASVIKSRWCRVDEAGTSQSAMRRHGARDASRCAWRPAETKAMLLAMLGHGATRSWNEIVLSPDTYLPGLPRAIDGVFFPAGNAHAELRARELHLRLIEHFYSGHENASWIPPLMSLDLVGGSIRSRPSSTTMARPFTLAKAEPSFATSRLLHKMHGTAFRRRSSGEHRMDMERTANLASEPRRSSGGMGVLMCLYMHSSTSLVGRMAVREGLAGASHLQRVMRPRYPVELHANQHALSHILRARTARELRNSIIPLTLSPKLQDLLHYTEKSSTRQASNRRDSFYAFLHKLEALRSTKFRRAVLLDADIRVIQPSLVHSLLNSTLRLADVAMPVDTNRIVWHGSGAESARYGAASDGAPPMCSCMVAFRNTPIVRSLWWGAAKRLIEGRHPSARQGDQEMIWFEWTTNLTELRMLVLPEEYYCPLGATTRPDEQAMWKTAGWPTGRYACKATHWHRGAQQRRR